MIHRTGRTLCLIFLLSFKSLAQGKDEGYRLSNRSAPQRCDTTTILKTIDDIKTMPGTSADIAISRLQETLSQSLSVPFATGVKNSLAQLLPLLDQKSAYIKKNKLLEETLRTCTTTPSLRPAIPFLYNALASSYQLQEKYALASRYYLLAIPMANQYDPAYLATLYNNYGSMLIAFNVVTGTEQQQGMLYLDKAERIAQQHEDYNIMTTVLINKANIYLNKNAYPEGLDALQKALSLASNHHLKKWEATALAGIGHLYYSMGKPKMALPYLKKVDTQQMGVDPYIQNQVTVTLGKVYYGLKDYRLAEFYLLKSLETAKKLRIGNDITEANSRLALLYANKGDYKMAFAYQFALQQLNDSLRSVTIAENIQRLDIKYRTAEKDKQLLKNQLDMEQQGRTLRKKNTLLLGMAASLLFLSLVSIIVYNRFRQRQKILLRDKEIREMRALIKGEEKERIRMAQELHDGIGGMLAAVNMNLSAAQKTGFQNKEALQHVMHMIAETTEEVRKTSHNLMPSALLRHNLKEALRHYCDYVNKDGWLLIDLNVQEQVNGIDTSYTVMIFRIVQELVQNIIKHAQATHAVIELERSGNHIQLIVEDNGMGFDVGNRASGLGLENLHYRISTLGGQLSIESQKGTGTSVSVSFAIR